MEEESDVPRLFVGGVAATIDREEIRPVFERFGPVEDVDVGFSGYAFVLMRHVGDAQTAIQELDSTTAFGDRRVNVKFSSRNGYLSAVRKRDSRRPDQLCYECKRPGHIARDCPDKSRGDFSRKRPLSPHAPRPPSPDPYRRSSPPRILPRDPLPPPRDPLPLPADYRSDEYRYGKHPHRDGRRDRDQSPPARLPPSYRDDPPRYPEESRYPRSSDYRVTEDRRSDRDMYSSTRSPPRTASAAIPRRGDHEFRDITPRSSREDPWSDSRSKRYGEPLRDYPREEPPYSRDPGYPAPRPRSPLYSSRAPRDPPPRESHHMDYAREPVDHRVQPRRDPRGSDYTRPPRDSGSARSSSAGRKALPWEQPTSRR